MAPWSWVQRYVMSLVPYEAWFTRFAVPATPLPDGCSLASQGLASVGAACLTVRGAVRCACIISLRVHVYIAYVRAWETDIACACPMEAASSRMGGAREALQSGYNLCLGRTHPALLRPCSVANLLARAYLIK